MVKTDTAKKEKKQDKKNLIPFRLPSNEKVDLCLDCLARLGREAKWFPLFMVGVMCMTAIPVGVAVRQLGPRLFLRPLENEFIVVTGLTTLSIAMAITCGQLIRRRSRQRHKLRKRVVRRSVWVDTNWLGTLFAMYLVLLLIVYIFIEIRMAALIGDAQDLSLQQWLALIVYAILWLMATVDIVRLFSGWGATPLHEQIGSQLAARQWRVVEA